MLDARKENIFTKKKFMAWLENKNGKYNFLDVRHCAVAQYLSDQFPDANIIVGGFYFLIDSKVYNFPLSIMQALDSETFEQLREKLKDIDF